MGEWFQLRHGSPAPCPGSVFNLWKVCRRKQLKPCYFWTIVQMALNCTHVLPGLDVWNQNNHQKSIWSQQYPCNTSRKMQSHAEHSMSQSFWNHGTSHGRQTLNITNFTKPTVIVPPVQIHVALLGSRCLYHHDVHGWWTTKGLWDVHMLRVRSTRPSQSLLGGTKRRSRLGTMPWPRITSMTLESCRFLSERSWKNFFNLWSVVSQTQQFAGFIAPWTVLVFKKSSSFPTMLFSLMQPASQSGHHAGGNRFSSSSGNSVIPKLYHAMGRWLFFRCIQRRLQGDLRKSSSENRQRPMMEVFGKFGVFPKKWWYPTTMGFPTKNHHFGVFGGTVI